MIIQKVIIINIIQGIWLLINYCFTNLDLICHIILLFIQQRLVIFIPRIISKNQFPAKLQNSSHSKVLQGDLLEVKFFFSLLLRLGKTYRPLVTLTNLLTSFHFRIYEIITQRKILKFGFRAAIWRLAFVDIFQKSMTNY